LLAPFALPDRLSASGKEILLVQNVDGAAASRWERARRRKSTKGISAAGVIILVIIIIIILAFFGLFGLHL